MTDTPFYKQAELLLDILPFFNHENKLALKGGTALNFFVRDLPRLSVDIDLTYLPVNEREEALRDLSEILITVSERIQNTLSKTHIIYKKQKTSNSISGLLIQRQGSIVKVEPNTIIRGAVLPVRKRMLCSKAENLFERSVSVQTLSDEDLYGGKICAALDRQHPRDLFDIYLLFENEGITDLIRKVFLVYLISHPRPMAELLDPNIKPIEKMFEQELNGMTNIPVNPKLLSLTLNDLVRKLKKDLTFGERKFLISVKEMKPEWDLLGLDHIEKLPAVQWKLINLKKMEESKRKEAVDKLKSILKL